QFFLRHREGPGDGLVEPDLVGPGRKTQRPRRHNLGLRGNLPSRRLQSGSGEVQVVDLVESRLTVTGEDGIGEGFERKTHARGQLQQFSGIDYRVAHQLDELRWNQLSGAGGPLGFRLVGHVAYLQAVELRKLAVGRKVIER